MKISITSNLLSVLLLAGGASTMTGCHAYSPSANYLSSTSSSIHRLSGSIPPSTATSTATTRRPNVRPALSMKAMPTPESVTVSSPRSRRTSLRSTVASAIPRRFRSTSASTTSIDEEQQQQHKFNWTAQNMAIALPALMGLLADPVLSMVDTGFVGRIGSMDLAALGVCTSIFHMAFTIFRASTVATTSLVGSAETQAEKREITKISLQFAGVMGTLTLLALRFGGPTLMATMGVSSTSPLYKPACDYLFARCWAAPAVVGIVVAEGAFRGTGDSKTPLIASSVAALINLILDPLLMFPLGMGMAGAAAATAISQVGAAGVFAVRLAKRKMLPQPNDNFAINKLKVIKSIIEANLSMLAKQGSMLVFYTMATALATRMGPAHVATHQVALSLFWLVTYWLDSGSISGQVLMSKQVRQKQTKENGTSPSFRAKSLTKYMLKYALLQGLAFSALVTGVGKFVPGLFTQDAAVQSLLFQCLPHLAMQQTLVSLTLIMEGLAIGGKQFRYMAGGTTVATAIGIWQLMKQTSVVGIWSVGVNTFFGLRFVNAIIGTARVHLDLRRKAKEEKEQMELSEGLATGTPASNL